jgi:hypothetical protein
MLVPANATPATELVHFSTKLPQGTVPDAAVVR